MMPETNDNFVYPMRRESSGTSKPRQPNSSPNAAKQKTASTPGIVTTTSDGQGAGIVTYADYSLVSSIKAANCGGVYTTCGAANPDDTLIIWATGLGPVNGDDASGAGLGVSSSVNST